MAGSEWSATKSSEIADAIYLFLEDTNPPPDKETMPRVSVQLCDLIEDTLSTVQREAVEVGRARLDGKDHGEYSRFLKMFADAIDADMRGVYADKTESARNRLVWCALTKNSTLSVESADFVVMQAEWVGLDLARISAVFRKAVPGFAAWLTEHGRGVLPE
ncbi:hypothetical protein [Luteibacter sp. dw_328]|uniref:hypothetical protein n=1 Tax=Luteibacter sp. dw_328 TaxID=2719796 RepID=UPI001BD4CFA9|nr:hypothetical protein [Luteibacter sp. dw_328]